MEHIAILSKSSGLLEKIMAGEKVIESRWYSARFAPWDRIFVDETIYFKYSGMPIQAKAKVKAVEQYGDLTPEKVEKLWIKHVKEIGICKKEGDNEMNELKQHIASTINKKYCILIHLKNAEGINKPFNIDKKGFGKASAWLIIDKVSRIRREEI
jgi:hypothetical protein